MLTTTGSMKKETIKKLSGNYEEWLIESLRDKEEAAIFLQVALEEFQKDGDVEALLLSLRHVVEAQDGWGASKRYGFSALR